jgi:putative ATP-dependent endonuclease of OLD family
MYLSSLKLWNFRKYGSGADCLDLSKPDLTVPFTQGLNVLIGENDSGKTAIIDAIKLVLRTHSGEWIRLGPEDFHRQANRLRVECRFDALSDKEAAHFVEWLGMEGEGENARAYLKVIVDVTKTGTELLHYDVRAGADDEGHPLDAEARSYLLATYLKPLRDADAELVPKRNSRLSQILSGLPAFKGKDEHEVRQISRCFECLLRMYFKREHKDENCRETECRHKEYFYGGQGDTDEGKRIRTDLQGMLDDFFGHADYEATFGVMPRELRNILEQFRLSLSDEELGLGSQNLLFIAAELLNLRRRGWTGLRLALIEELEAHLHPQAQMRVIEYLQQRTEPKTSAEKTEDAESGPASPAGNDPGSDEENRHDGFQAILTTHSPNLASKVRLKNVILCQGRQVFPMGPEHTRLKGPDYAFLERFLDVTKANLFFAKGVILVEGPSEELILPTLAKKVGRDLTKAGVSVVNVGNTAFLRYAKIFLRKNGLPMDVPVAVVTDLDVKPDEYKSVDAQAKTECDRDVKQARNAKAKKYDEQKVKTFVSPHWTFEYCIARSILLAEHLYQAIKDAIDEMREDGQSIAAITETYEVFSKDKTPKDIAFDLYHDVIVQKEVSKPIVAQHFAAGLEKADIAEPSLSDKDSTGYLIDAITYVTSANNNQ